MEFFETQDTSPFLDKMRRGELTLEEILNNDSIIDDIKSREHSDFLEFFTNKHIKKLIDYSTRFPKSDDHYTGYKYPFNSTEILCSGSLGFFNKLMSEKKIKENTSKKKKAKEFVKKIPKGGFFEVFFKAIKKAEGNGNTEEIFEEWNNNDTDNDSIEEENDENKNEENIVNNNYNNSNLIFNYYRNSLDSVNEIKNKDNVIYENIDHLLGFLKESEETRKNYVLEGYFHRILSNLLTMDKQGKLIRYLLNYPNKEEFDVLNHFVKNMKRKSKNMFNIIQKLLLFKEDQDHIYSSFNRNTNNLLKEKKINLLKLILKELDITTEQDKYECICDSLCGLMTKTQFLENDYNDLNPLEYLYKILLNSKNNIKKSNYILTLLIKINENILKLFDSRCTPIVEEETEDSNDLMNMYSAYNYNALNNFGNLGNNRYGSINEDNRTKILEKILMNLFDILEKNKFEFLEDFGQINQEINKEFISTYLEKQKKIGIKKISEIEYIRTLLDIFINSCYPEYFPDKVEILIHILNEKNIFWNLHNLFFLFPFSNIYQIYYAQIIDIVININSPKCLIDYFFQEKNEKKNLVDIYINKILLNSKFEFKLTNTKVLSPDFSFVINLLNKINNTDNNYLKEKYLNENENFEIFIEIFGKDIENIFTQKLLSTNTSNNYGFNFNDNKEEKLNYFGKKNFMELLEEDFDIYAKYKKGENYKKILEEKRKRIEKEKEQMIKKDKKLEEKKHKNINEIDDDDDDDDNPLFKIEKIKQKDNNKNNFNFLSILNESEEDKNKIVENIMNNNNSIENNIQQKEDNELDIKDLDNDEEIINDINVNDDIEPNKIENKMYNKKYNEELNEEIKENKQEDKKDKNENNEDNVNINEIGEAGDDDIVDI